PAKAAGGAGGGGRARALTSDTFDSAASSATVSCGLGHGATQPSSAVDAKRGQVEWQNRVLSHLRRLYDTREGGDEAAATTLALALTERSGPNSASGGGGPFREQLDLSEFVLRRITHAVNVLQDPQKHDRPMVLREYTEEMVQEVCKDLKQWLEQLATLLSLYHVHILDQEAEKRQVAARLHDLQSKFDQHEKERKDAMLRHTRLEERWKEDRMQRRAEALLGIKNQGEDAKIYSQRDVDEMMKEWEKERVDPLLEELKELKLARDEMLSKLQGDKKPPRPREKAPEDLGGVGRKELDLMTSIMSAASEKVSDSTMSDLLTQVGESISSGG
ncbi:unnamed protein product, partial [Polarella glacialis]